MIQQLSLLREEEEEVIKRLEEAPVKKRLDEIKDKIEQARREQTNTSQLEQEKAALERDLSPLIEAAARSRLEILAFAELAQRLGEGLPAPEHPGYFVREPDNAFHIPLEPTDEVIRFKLWSRDGEQLAGGERQIRIVSKTIIQVIGLLLALLPLVLMVMVLVARVKGRRRFAKLERSANSAVSES